MSQMKLYLSQSKSEKFSKNSGYFEQLMLDIPDGEG